MSIADPCHWVYASGKKCGMPADNHGRGTKSGPQHEWLAGGAEGASTTATGDIAALPSAVETVSR